VAGSVRRSLFAALVCALLVAAPAGAAPKLLHEGDQLALKGAPATVGKLRLKARAVGCRHATATILVDGSELTSVTFGHKARRVKIPITPAVAAPLVRVLAADCDLMVRRLRGIAGVIAPVAEPFAPVTPTLPLGVAVAASQLVYRSYTDTILSTFSSVTPENELKMDRTQPKPGDWRFAAADAVIGFAARNHLQIRGHTLVFGTATPKWVGEQQLPQLIESTMTEQIQTVMERYRSRIHQWDVVNEALAPNGSWRHNAFFDAMGPDYVRKAFSTARQADPSAKLFYNELGAEYDNPKQRALIALARRLKGEGLLDGVGIQMHVGITQPPTYDELVHLLQTLGDMGLEVELTEMDVAAGGLAPLDQRLQRQAEIYADAGRACRDVPACKRVTVWGVSDRVTWLQPTEIPLLFDAEYNAKPALDALRSALTAPAVA
jgi:endo-1,4-beta-xylanase